jgi:PAS domain S-box-containing protein
MPPDYGDPSMFSKEGGTLMETHSPEWLYQQIVEGAQDAIVFADKDGIIRLWNKAAEAIFGYSAKEALGQSLDLIVPEKLRERHWEGYRKVMDTGVTKYGSDILAVPALKKDDSRISVEFTIILLSDDAGKPVGTAAIIRDVTERWQKEKELKKRLAELEEREKKM